MAHEQTITVGIDGKFFNIPSVVDRDGKLESPQVAIEHARKNNNFGTPFDDIQSAVAAAKARSANFRTVKAPQTAQVESSVATPPAAPDVPPTGSTEISKADFTGQPFRGNLVADRIAQYEPIIQAAAQKYGVRPALIKAVIYHESGGDPKARSKQDAMGLMQLIPGTWSDMGGGDPNDPATNIDHGTKYLAMQLKEFGSEEAALAAYHQGPGTTRVTGGRPAGPRTRHYVQVVPATAARFALNSGPMEPPAPEPAITEVAVANIAQRDPRLAVINEGIRLLGKTPAEYQKELSNPRYVESLYAATMRHAESLDPKLDMTQGEAAYLNVLKAARGPNDPAPPAPAEPPPLPPSRLQRVVRSAIETVGNAALNPVAAVTAGGTSVPPDVQAATRPSNVTQHISPPETAAIPPPEPLTGRARVAQQVGNIPNALAGSAVDVARGVVETGEDAELWMRRGNEAFKQATGVSLMVEPNAGDPLRTPSGHKVSNSIEEWANETIGMSVGVVDGLVRGYAAFLVPYTTMLRATGAASWVARTAVSAGVTFMQDPDDPLSSEAIEGLARGLSPENPGVIRGIIKDYIMDKLPEDEMIRRLAMRGLRATEDVAMGAVTDAVIFGIRSLRDGYRVKYEGIERAATQAEIIATRNANTPPVEATSVVARDIAAQREIDAIETSRYLRQLIDDPARATSELATPEARAALEARLTTMGMSAAEARTAVGLVAEASTTGATRELPELMRIAEPDIKPGVSATWIDPTGVLLPHEANRYGPIFQKTAPRFDLVRTPQHLQDMIGAAESLLRDVPLRQINDELFHAGRSTDELINTVEDVAWLTGAKPRSIQAYLDRTGETIATSARVKALIYLAQKLNNTLSNFVARSADDIMSGRVTNAPQGVVDLYTQAGELAKGFDEPDLSSGRMLNAMGQTADGHVTSPDTSGGVEVNPESIEAFVEMLGRLSAYGPGAVGKHARKFSTPTYGGMLTEAWFNAVLATPSTIIKTAASAVEQLLLTPITRTAGALRIHGREAVGHMLGSEWLQGVYKPGESPELTEGLAMMGTGFSEIWQTAKVFTDALRTGDSPHLVRGASLGATPHFPVQPPQQIPGGIGWIVNLAGKRPMYAIDAALQYLVKRMEVKALAIRKAAVETFPDDAARARFIEEIVQNPEDHLDLDELDQIAFKQQSASFMTPLADNREGYKWIRSLAVVMDRWAAKHPVTRIIMPFVKTGLNVASRLADYTPLVNQANANMRSSNPWIRSEALGRSTVGWLTMVGTAMMGAAGIIRGKMTNDPEYTRELELAGTPENSMDTPIGTIRLDPQQPLGWMLTTGAMIGAWASGDQPSDKEMGLATLVLDRLHALLANQKFVTALGRVLTLTDPARVENKLEGDSPLDITGKTVDELFLKPLLGPRGWQELVSIVSPEKPAVDSWLEEVATRNGFTPGAKRQTDIFMRPRYQGAGMSDESINNALRIVPGVPMWKVQQDELSQKLTAKHIHIPDPSRVLTRGNVSIRLEDAELQRLRELIFQPSPFVPNLRDNLMALMSDPRWESLSDERADLEVKHVVGQYSEAARQYLYAESTTLQQRMRDRARVQGLLPE